MSESEAKTLPDTWKKLYETFRSAAIFAGASEMVCRVDSDLETYVESLPHIGPTDKTSMKDLWDTVAPADPPGVCLWILLLKASQARFHKGPEAIAWSRIYHALKKLSTTCSDHANQWMNRLLNKPMQDLVWEALHDPTESNEAVGSILNELQTSLQNVSKDTAWRIIRDVGKSFMDKPREAMTLAVLFMYLALTKNLTALPITFVLMIAAFVLQWKHRDKSAEEQEDEFTVMKLATFEDICEEQLELANQQIEEQKARIEELESELHACRKNQGELESKNKELLRQIDELTRGEEPTFTKVTLQSHYLSGSTSVDTQTDGSDKADMGTSTSFATSDTSTEPDDSAEGEPSEAAEEKVRLETELRNLAAEINAVRAENARLADSAFEAAEAAEAATAELASVKRELEKLNGELELERTRKRTEPDGSKPESEPGPKAEESDEPHAVSMPSSSRPTLEAPEADTSIDSASKSVPDMSKVDADSDREPTAESDDESSAVVGIDRGVGSAAEIEGPAGVLPSPAYPKLTSEAEPEAVPKAAADPETEPEAAAVIGTVRDGTDSDEAEPADVGDGELAAAETDTVDATDGKRDADEAMIKDKLVADAIAKALAEAQKAMEAARMHADAAKKSFASAISQIVYDKVSGPVPEVVENMTNAETAVYVANEAANTAKEEAESAREAASTGDVKAAVSAKSQAEQARDAAAEAKGEVDTFVAEAIAILTERRKAEERRIVEERKRAAAEERAAEERKRAEERAAEERKRAEERAAEERRRAAEERAAEERKRAEERAAEERRRADASVSSIRDSSDDESIEPDGSESPFDIKHSPYLLSPGSSRSSSPTPELEEDETPPPTLHPGWVPKTPISRVKRFVDPRKRAIFSRSSETSPRVGGAGRRRAPASHQPSHPSSANQARPTHTLAPIVQRIVRRLRKVAAV